ncbi:MAG: hypothetical protein K1W03_09125, partial [Mailhella sp.]
MKRICMHVLMVLALFFPFSGFAQEKNMVDNEMKFQEIDNDLEAMIGQMLMFGMRGQSLAEDVEIRKMLEQGKAGGIILFYTHGNICVLYASPSPRARSGSGGA